MAGALVVPVLGVGWTGAGICFKFPLLARWGLGVVQGTVIQNAKIKE